MVYPYFEEQVDSPHKKYKGLFIASVLSIFVITILFTSTPKITGFAIINDYSNTLSVNLLPLMVTVILLTIATMSLFRKH